MKTDITEIISKTIKDVTSQPLYPELSHNVNAANYPHGVIEYFKIEKFKLIENIGQKSMFGNAWKNSGCVEIRFSLITEFYKNVQLNDPVWSNSNKSENEFNSFVREDFMIFLRDYYAYNRYLEKIRKIHIDPKSLSFKIDDSNLLSLFEKWKEKKYIHQNTDYNHFKYAIRGDEIPAQQPYKPINWNTQNSTLYLELLDLEKNMEKINQKSLTNQRKTSVQDLFLNEKGKPMKKLSNPK